MDLFKLDAAGVLDFLLFMALMFGGIALAEALHLGIVGSLFLGVSLPLSFGLARAALKRRRARRLANATVIGSRLSGRR